MSMSKKDFVALADVVRNANKYIPNTFTEQAIFKLANFCRSQNSAFKEDRWRDYIAGKCGKSGGEIKDDPA